MSLLLVVETQLEQVLLAVVLGLLCTLALLVLKPSGTDVFHLLTRTRRSLGTPEQYSGEAAPKATIRKALECAIHAPNHFLSEPWRFRMLNTEQRTKIETLCKWGGKKPLFAKVPQMMCVSIEPSKSTDETGTWHIKSLEDHAACACAVQNFMVYLASQGVGTKWMTGALGIDGETILSEVCGDDTTESEHFMGVILIGMPAQALDSIKVPKRKTGLDAPVLIEY